ncbi:PREDICTED: ycf20-like protein isoform X2 [Tarenaya hassleriana]|uniref:ycf20-like protein isoform X2 n=1 Tax=Tarenaya hassleriana TaxID=28532 RepID=UPI00053C71AD|nr:PREDICTED: ycf20-like protein isoform X2 [Tarenaya hassleriana]
MGVAITVALPKYGRKPDFLPKKLVKGWEFCTLCQFRHPARSFLVRHHRRMSWRIKSSVDDNGFSPSSSTSSNSSGGPRLIKAILDLRSKITVKIQETKKDLPMKVFFLLVGFYSATAFSTVIGQTGDWDVLSAALAVLVVEGIGALMYKASIPLINKIRSLITIFNYWKTGLALGLFLDSFKF